MEAIPCGKTLEKHHIQNDCICLLCGHNEETIDHTFLLCPLARSLWFGTDLGVRSEFIREISLSKWHDEWFQQWSTNKQELNNTIILVMLVLDCIWKSRNEALHNKKSIDNNVVLQVIKARWNIYITVSSNKDSLLWPRKNRHVSQEIPKVGRARLVSSCWLIFWTIKKRSIFYLLSAVVSYNMLKICRMAKCRNIRKRKIANTLDALNFLNLMIKFCGEVSANINLIAIADTSLATKLTGTRGSNHEEGNLLEDIRHRLRLLGISEIHGMDSSVKDWGNSLFEYLPSNLLV